MNMNEIVRKHSKPGSRILCAGGPSRHLGKLKLQGVKIVSINLKDRDYIKLKSRDTLVIGSATETPFKDESFDVYFSSNVYEHIDEPWRAAEEAVRVLRRGSLILIFGPFAWRHHDKPDYWRYTSEGFQYLFERTGKVKTIETKMVKLKKPKDKRWHEYWRTYYYGIKK